MLAMLYRLKELRPHSDEGDPFRKIRYRFAIWCAYLPLHKRPGCFSRAIAKKFDEQKGP